MVPSWLIEATSNSASGPVKLSSILLPALTLPDGHPYTGKTSPMNRGKRSAPPSVRPRPGACHAAHDALQPQHDRDDSTAGARVELLSLAGNVEV